MRTTDCDACDKVNGTVLPPLGASSSEFSFILLGKSGKVSQRMWP